ncbi:MAG: hypothetical protein H6Q13_2773 [Bacteroidetes bacterium]|nr:hypothetical protein [Bacteroidota bacterium]
MAREDENAGVGNIDKNMPSSEKANDFEKGRRIGRIEGMIAYQKHLIANLQKDNAKLMAQLIELNK